MAPKMISQGGIMFCSCLSVRPSHFPATLCLTSTTMGTSLCFTDTNFLVFIFIFVCILCFLCPFFLLLRTYLSAKYEKQKNKKNCSLIVYHSLIFKTETCITQSHYKYDPVTVCLQGDGFLATCSVRYLLWSAKFW